MHVSLFLKSVQIMPVYRTRPILGCSLLVRPTCNASYCPQLSN